jgi:hypothetical protein
LPPDIQELLGDHDGYDFFRVMPLVEAMDKPGGLTRQGFEYMDRWYRVEFLGEHGAVGIEGKVLHEDGTFSVLEKAAA